MFDFSKALEQAKSVLSNNGLEAIILGPSGAGKSSLLGSFGVPTLYLFSTGENHGPKAAEKRAKESGSQVYPVCMDYADGRQLTAEETYARVLSVLGEGGSLAKNGIKAIAVDGAAELEIYIRDTKEWKDACKSASGKHNAFAEPAATCAMFRPIFNALKALQRDHGIHFAMTCMLDVKEYGPSGEVVEGAPRLKGFQVAEMLLQQFGDVLVVGRMTKGNESKWKLQFMTDITKAAKDDAGLQKRAINFNPRLSGVTVPAVVDADLRAVISLKEVG